MWLLVALSVLAAAAFVRGEVAARAERNATGGIHGQILAIFETEKTPDVVDALARFSVEERRAMAEAGWMESEQTFRIEKGVPRVTVTVAGQQTITDDEGHYTLTNIPAGQQMVTIAIRDEVLTHQSIIIRPNVDRFKNIYAFTADPVKHELMDAPEGENSNAYLPCSDCNGPYGNCGTSGHVWSDSSGSNFWGSDCFWSLTWYTNCVLYHTNWAYCNGSRNCSPLIGHSSSHHCH